MWHVRREPTTLDLSQKEQAEFDSWARRRKNRSKSGFAGQDLAGGADSLSNIAILSELTTGKHTVGSGASGWAVSAWTVCSASPASVHRAGAATSRSPS